MTEFDPILLILDVDETLVFSSEQRLDRDADCVVGPYSVYRRPHLDVFLRTCQQNFQMAVWSSSSEDYLDAMIQNAFPNELQLVFKWSRQRCTQRFDPERQETVYIKDLKKVKRIGFDLNRVLMIEDTPQKIQRNYGNALYVRPYYGDPGDNELAGLGRYLESLRSLPNVRHVEKRNWKQWIGSSPWQVH